METVQSYLPKSNLKNLERIWEVKPSVGLWVFLNFFYFFFFAVGCIVLHFLSQTSRDGIALGGIK